MTLATNFIKRFGKKQFEAVMNNMGIHSENCENLTVEDEKLSFALLEILDFDCYEYAEYHENIKLTEQQIKRFLWDNRKRVKKMKMEPPSYLGAIDGVYSFLSDKKRP